MYSNMRFTANHSVSILCVCVFAFVCVFFAHRARLYSVILPPIFCCLFFAVILNNIIINNHMSFYMNA